MPAACVGPIRVSLRLNPQGPPKEMPNRYHRSSSCKTVFLVFGGIPIKFLGNFRKYSPFSGDHSLQAGSLPTARTPRHRSAICCCCTSENFQITRFYGVFLYIVGQKLIFKKPIFKPVSAKIWLKTHNSLYNQRCSLLTKSRNYFVENDRQIQLDRSKCDDL